MCGRYASARRVEDLAATFGVEVVDAVPEPDWNVAPTKPIAAVVVRDGARTLTTMRWGLVPPWAEQPTARLVNARIETVADKPAFRAALAARRCLIPADGWYEWARRPDGARVPHYLAPADGSVIGFAGIWEVWYDAERRPLVSAAILTGAAPGDLAAIHDRAPVVVPPDAWAAWLDPDVDPTGLLRATPPGAVRFHPVGPAVGDVRAAGPQLVEPVALDEQPTLF